MKGHYTSIYIPILLVLAIVGFFWTREGFQGGNPCEGHADCKSCAGAAGCGWCTDKSVCLRMAQDGYPERTGELLGHHVCNPFKFRIFPEQCGT